MCGDDISGGARVGLSTPLREIVMAFRAMLPVTVFLFLLLRHVEEPLPLVVLRPAGAASLLDHDDANEDMEELGVGRGLLASWCGLLLFNIGLTYGLTALGKQEGAALPREYVEVNGSSPLHGYRVGVLIVLSFAFFLGVGATMAEPALAAVASQVERLTQGRFNGRIISRGVPAGVATGLVLGILKIVLEIELLAILLPLYPLAILLTVYSTEEFVNIAWDSAGVTTGPVTVPLVLSIGSSLGYVSGREGFGVLSCCSICPIMAVLLWGRARARAAGVAPDVIVTPSRSRAES
jgi:hypothetical protein